MSKDKPYFNSCPYCGKCELIPRESVLYEFALKQGPLLCNHCADDKVERETEQPQTYESASI